MGTFNLGLKVKLFLIWGGSDWKCLVLVIFVGVGEFVLRIAILWNSGEC